MAAVFRLSAHACPTMTKVEKSAGELAAVFLLSAHACPTMTKVEKSALRRLKFDTFRVKRPAAAPRARNTGADLTQSHGAEGRRAGAPRHWSRENKCAAEATAQRPVTTGHLGGWGKEYTEQPATK